MDHLHGLASRLEEGSGVALLKDRKSGGSSVPDREIHIVGRVGHSTERLLDSCDGACPKTSSMAEVQLFPIE